MAGRETIKNAGKIYLVYFNMQYLLASSIFIVKLVKNFEINLHTMYQPPQEK